MATAATEPAAPKEPTTLTKRQRLDMLKAQCKDARTPFEQDWRELGDFLVPGRYQFTVGERAKRRRLSNKVIDSTASYSLGVVSAGLQTGVTSSARDWFQVTTPDPDLAEVPAVKDWLHVVTKRLQAIFARSNWYKALSTLYKDAAAFGTAAMMIIEDDEKVIHCQTFLIGTYWIATDSRGRVRTFVREFGMTVQQIVDQFGRDNLSPSTKLMVDAGRWGEVVTVTHIVHTNADYDTSKFAAQSKRFYSCYYESAGPQGEKEQYLEESGFDEFSVLAMRWETDGESAYGSDCPGMRAIGDVKQLQAMKRLMLKGIQKQVDPPMVGPPELQMQRASIISGDITFIQERGTRPSFYPAHEVRINLNDLRGEENEVRALIRRAFYEDILLMVSTMDEQTGSTQPRTAAEIEVRQQEKLLVFGPMLEQLNEDVLDPGIDRVFGIAVRKGHIPPAPPELEGQALRVEYISIMHSAQKAQGTDRIERFASFVGGLSEGDPSSPVWDKVDRDQLIDEYGDILSVPPRIVVPDDQVNEIRQKRAQAAQAEKTAATLSQLAPAAQQLSETDVQKPSALSALLGGGAQNLAGVP